MASEETKFEKKSFADLLTSTPPGGLYEVPDFGYVGTNAWILSVPQLQLHCPEDSCGGIRYFDGGADDSFVRRDVQNIFMTYKCRNCKKTSKTYSLVAFTSAISGGFESIVVKIGELPAFGPHTPARVISLIGPDRDLFLKGRRAENQGLGIGAFGYYRRVVENQKGRLIEEIAKVARRLGADAPTLAQFERAANETQFSRAIDDIKGAIPQSLLIQSQNPLALLHSALSEGLHAQTDEECLELATSIRVVLTELAERISQALKDEADLRQAVTRLLTKGLPAKVGSDGP